MCRLCWISVIVLLALSATLLTKFIILGETLPSNDGRTSIIVEPGERDLILEEMRSFLVSVQAIVVSANADAMPAVAEAARKSGMQAQGEVPAALIGKLPLSFKTLGFDTHKRFDQLALDAGQFGDKAHALQQLGELMNNCIACHASYQLVAQDPGSN